MQDVVAVIVAIFVAIFKPMHGVGICRRTHNRPPNLDEFTHPRNICHRWGPIPPAYGSSSSSFTL